MTLPLRVASFTKRLRLLTMKYPSGKTLTYAYGTLGSQDDPLGSFTEIREGTAKAGCSGQHGSIAWFARYSW